MTKQKLSLARIATVVSSLVLVGAYVAYRSLWTHKPVVNAGQSTPEAEPPESTPVETFSGSKSAAIFKPSKDAPREFIGSSKLGIILKPSDVKRLDTPPNAPPADDPETNPPGDENPGEVGPPSKKPVEKKPEGKNPNGEKPPAKPAQQPKP
jgi:hypothetical protein